MTILAKKKRQQNIRFTHNTEHITIKNSQTFITNGRAFSKKTEKLKR